MQIDFNNEEAVKAYLERNKTQTKDASKNFFSEMSKILSHVEENEIKDKGFGNEFNRKRSEHEKLFKFASIFKDGEKEFIKVLKSALDKYDALLFSYTDERKRENLKRYIEFIEMEIRHFDSSSSTLKKINLKPINTKPNLLIDIWEANIAGTKDEYHKIIEFLKLHCCEIGKPLLTEISGKLHWYGGKGAIQYLKGFIWTCLNKKWIIDKYSAPKYKEILKNTFDVKFSQTPFKQLYANPPKEMYLMPFKDLPSNS